MSIWLPLARRYNQYLRLERTLSDNTVDAYQEDLSKLIHYLDAERLAFADVRIEHLSHFMATLHDQQISARSRARILSGVRSFFHFLLLERLIDADPTELLESPTVPLHLPTVLSLDEVDALLAAIDLSTAEGHRNRAIVETLFSCGIRVSELVTLRLSDVYVDEQFIRVIGKGDKQRFVPISPVALKEIALYLIDRNRLPIQPAAQDILFLNRRGFPLTRVMILIMIKKNAQRAGITKVISPHTLRHTFATLLLKNGADLRAIQQMMGHRKIASTEVYLHLDREDIRKEILEHHPRNTIRHTK